MSEVITIDTSELATLIKGAVAAGVKEAMLVKDLRESYTVKEVAEMYGRNPRWVRKMIEEGHFETYKMEGTVTMIKAKSIRNF